MARISKNLRVGNKAPDFELPDAQSGQIVKLERFRGRPLMIIFLRGTW